MEEHTKAKKRLAAVYNILVVKMKRKHDKNPFALQEVMAVLKETSGQHIEKNDAVSQGGTQAHN